MSNRQDILPPGWDGGPVSRADRRALLWLLAVALVVLAFELWINYG